MYSNSQHVEEGNQEQIMKYGRDRNAQSLEFQAKAIKQSQCVYIVRHPSRDRPKS